MERKVYKFHQALRGAMGRSILSRTVCLQVMGQTERC